MAVVTTSPVVAQVWRDGRRQARMAGLLAATHISAPDQAAARRAGEILGRTGGNDVVDALVSTLAQDGDTLVTGDSADITRLLAAAGIRATLVPA